MIALPVLALAFVAASYDMAELTPAERVDRRLGAADAELRWVADVPVGQDEWGETWYPREGDLAPGGPDGHRRAGVGAAGPRQPGHRVRSRVPLRVRGPEGDEDGPSRRCWT